MALGTSARTSEREDPGAQGGGLARCGTPVWPKLLHASCQGHSEVILGPNFLTQQLESVVSGAALQRREKMRSRGLWAIPQFYKVGLLQGPPGGAWSGGAGEGMGLGRVCTSLAHWFPILQG